MHDFVKLVSTLHPRPRVRHPTLGASALLLMSACGGNMSSMEPRGDAEAALDATVAALDATVASEGGAPTDGAVGGGDSGARRDAGPLPDLTSRRTSANVFVSGHSLTDNPLPDDMEAIARSLGTSMSWNQQNVIGSPLRIRTRGDGSSGWSGYSRGKNRSGSDMNVLNELRNPQTLGGARYDTLVITERHDLLSSLFYEDTVRFLRHYHERFIEGNPQGLSYFYEPWLGIPDKANPARWITYERAALPIWECVVTRINHSLEAEGRGDRITTLPAAVALTELVEQAIAGNVEGVSGGSTRQVVDRLFHDDVHLTKLGVYYMALVSYAAVYRQSPVGASAPAEVTATQAASLQRVAWEYVARYYAEPVAPTLNECQELMRESGCRAYWTFREQTGNIGACVGSFGKQERENPFWFDAANDVSFWFAAP